MVSASSIKRLALTGLGVSSLKWMRRPAGLYCFNYHRIGNSEKTLFDPNVFSCTEETFDRHVRFYVKNFDIVTIDELDAIVSAGSVIKERIALITFDDGYKDNYESALPILMLHGVPAVFFVTTDYIDSHTLPWWDEIAYIVRACRAGVIKLDGWDDAVPIDQSAIDLVIREILKRVKADSHRQMDEKLGELREVTGVTLGKSHCLDLFVDWSNLKYLLQCGMDIGSHTCSHRILSHLSIDEQREEIKKSKSILQCELEFEVKSFAYPVGGSDAYSCDSEQLLEEYGYRFGFTSMPGVNVSLKSQFSLRRILVAGDCSLLNIKSMVAFSENFG